MPPAHTHSPPLSRGRYGLAAVDPTELEKHRQEEWRKSQRRRDIDMDKKYCPQY